jgi:hypothetical protein
MPPDPGQAAGLPEWQIAVVSSVALIAAWIVLSIARRLLAPKRLRDDDSNIQGDG